MRYPLIDFHGNCGNRGGDGPAAYRYTEARLAKITEEGMLSGIKKKSVDFEPNYSETKDEPITLPSFFPNLLCNPNSGIGVALACSWQPHNLCEVADAIYAYLNGEEPTLPGPDFPTGGLIINKKDIPAIMKTGHGSIKIRGKYLIEDNNIVFYEIPYGITTESLLEEIGEAADNEKIPGIVNIRDESNKKGLRIVIECSKSVNLNKTISLLFKETSLQSSISYNQVALVNKVPTELNLKDCIKVYVDHGVECIMREASYDLEKAKAKLHITLGLIKALDIIDDIIAMIKSSESSSVAKETLKSKWEFSEEQAKAILDMKLSKLSKLEKDELVNEKIELENLIIKLEELYNNPIPELKNRLSNIVQTYGDARRTEIGQVDDKFENEEEIALLTPPEKCVVVMTEAGTIKRVPIANFKSQSRGGKGVKTNEEITKDVIRTNTTDSLMIFTTKGKMYRLIVNDIPAGTNTSKGTPVKALVPMESDEFPATIYSIYRETDSEYVLFVTKNGLVKKTPLKDYIDTKKKAGLGAINIKDDDELAAVSLLKDEKVLLITKNGMLIKINSVDIPSTGRLTSGVKGIALGKEDSIVSVLPIRDENDDLAIISSTGFGKRITLNDIITQSRGGKGIACHKPVASHGYIAAAQLVNDKDHILIIGNKSSICISAADINKFALRTAVGVVVFKGGMVVSASKV